MPQNPNSHNLKTATGKSGGQPIKNKVDLNPPNVSEKDFSIPQPSNVEHANVVRFPEPLQDEVDLALESSLGRESITEADGLAGEIEVGERKKEKRDADNTKQEDKDEDMKETQWPKTNLAESTMIQPRSI